MTTGTPNDQPAGGQVVYLNGEFMPIEAARVPVLDRGFIFGDGIYEVVPVYDGVPFRWPQHFARLERSLAKIRIRNPLDEKGWTDLVHALIARHPWRNQFVYLQITRGVARRDHAFPKESTPTVFAMASEFVLPAQATVERGIKAITLPDERWLHCDIKSTSLLGNVLARQAAADAGALECIMFRDGRMTEGSSSNIWVVRDGKLLTAPRDELILEGIRVGLLQELAAIVGMPFESARLTIDEVRTADELMVTSATKEILAITELDGKPVGDGRPGPVFRRLLDAYQQAKAKGRA
ncbi:MAG: D-amino acid aminotransferase [Lautropia sp.]